MSFLQLENLQNFLKNNLIYFSESNNSKNTTTETLTSNIQELISAGNNSLFYFGNNPAIILTLVVLNNENLIELNLGEVEFLDKTFKKSKIPELFFKKSKTKNLYLYTSGTTGKPKKVKVDKKKLFNSVNTTKERALNWILAYNPRTFAGLQVLLTAYLSKNKIYTSNEISLKALNKILKTQNINAISATPTFYRLLLNSKEFLSKKFKIITIGGEIINQDVLQKLSQSFKNAKITQIYATTELGKIFSISDKKEGFPIEYLKKYNLRIIENNLHVKKGNKLLPTNDLVRVEKDRVYFTGRNTNFVKIAGNRVEISNIEKKIISLNNVIDAKIGVRKSSLVGQLIIADVVLRNDSDKSRMEFKKNIKNTLNRFEEPKLINFVDSLKVNRNLKKTI